MKEVSNVFEAILKYGHDEDFVERHTEEFVSTNAPAGSREDEMHRIFAALCCIALLAACGGKGQGDPGDYEPLDFETFVDGKEDTGYLSNKAAELEARLEEAADCRTKLIATDGVFSMEGDIADLKTMREFWRLIRRERPDILHAHSPALNGLAALRAGRHYVEPQRNRSAAATVQPCAHR